MKRPACYCGHVRHINDEGLCLAKGCFCLIYRPRQTPLDAEPAPEVR